MTCEAELAIVVEASPTETIGRLKTTESTDNLETTSYNSNPGASKLESSLGPSKSEASVVAIHAEHSGALETKAFDSAVTSRIAGSEICDSNSDTRSEKWVGGANTSTTRDLVCSSNKDTVSSIRTFSSRLSQVVFGRLSQVHEQMSKSSSLRGVDDTAISETMGLRPKLQANMCTDRDQHLQVSQVGPQEQVTSNTRNMCYIISTLPRFLANELMWMAVPLLVALAPVAASSILVRFQMRALPTYQGRLWSLPDSPELPPVLFLLSSLPDILGNIACLAWVPLLCGTLWRWRLVKPIITKYVLPWSVVTFAWRLSRPWLVRHNLLAAGTAYSIFFLWWACNSACLGVTFCRVGNVMREHAFAYVFAPVQLLQLSVGFALFPQIVRQACQGGDVAIALFAGLGIPFLGEVLAKAPSRLVARSMTYNHPSTSFVSVGLVSMLLKLQIWYCSSVIQSPTYIVVLLLLALGMQAVFCVATVQDAIDRLFYRLLGFRSEHTEQRLSQMRSSSNRGLAANLGSFDLLGDLCGIWVTTAYILAFDASSAPGTPPNVQEMLLKGLMESCLTILFYSFCVVYDTISGYPYQVEAATRFQGWTPVVSFHMFISSMTACALYYPAALHRSEGNQGMWMWECRRGP